MTRNVRRWGRVASLWIGGALLALIGMLALYAVAGLVGGAIPVNRGWRPPERGVRVFVESNGVHLGIVVPKNAAGVDWRELARPEHLADPRYGAHLYLSFGWGERDFYLDTPSWADVRLRTVVAAATGSDRTLMHVDHVPEPRAGDTVRAITLRPEEYRRLAAHIRAGFAPAPGHRHGYGPYDAFYDAKGRYSMVRTCNEWVGDGLRQAGVRVGAWTPFPVTVLNWF
jgi:uncharacterized protein (TIGR02117 family)